MGGKHEKTAECPAWNNTCFGCGFRGHFKSLCKSKRCFIPVKGVHEVQETNTGKSTKNKNINVVDVIQSLSLCEQKAKNNVNVQELTVKTFKSSVSWPSTHTSGECELGKLSNHGVNQVLCSYTSKNWDH